MTLGAPLHRLARDTRRFENEWPQAAGRIIEEEATRQVAAVTGGDGYLSKWRELGPAETRVDARPGDCTVTAIGQLWRVLENGTNAHDVEAHRQKQLATPHGPRKQVHVKGRQPMHVWSKVADNAGPRVQQATRDVLQRLGG